MVLRYNLMKKIGNLIMKTVLLAIDFVSAFLLIVMILMHSPKGEGLGGIGGQAKIYNAQKGMEAGLNKITGVLAFIFIVVSLILGILY